MNMMKSTCSCRSLTLTEAIIPVPTKITNVPNKMENEHSGRTAGMSTFDDSIPHNDEYSFEHLNYDGEDDISPEENVYRIEVTGMSDLDELVESLVEKFHENCREVDAGPEKDCEGEQIFDEEFDEMVSTTDSLVLEFRRRGQREAKYLERLELFQKCFSSEYSNNDG